MQPSGDQLKDAEPVKKCTRNGCKKKYKESENCDTACCHYHPG
jgi:hypothetical protein